MRMQRIGMKGPDVSRWQRFLGVQGFSPGAADGEFGKTTETATKCFQKQHHLEPDGIVANLTLSKARGLGYLETADPPPPDFPALASNAARQQVFGKFSFEHRPIPGNPENIVITDGWQKDNIVGVIVPELIGIAGAPRDGRVWFHKQAAPQLLALWADWAQAGLLDRVVLWGGAFVPRFVRGSRSVLSNHSFGTAFDINMAQNGLGVEPAGMGMEGCVRELVPLANKHGFYWGGHFKRRDGMHFEIAQLK
jgi:hypothetical protein